MPGQISLQTPPGAPPLHVLVPGEAAPEPLAIMSRSPIPKRAPSPSPSSASRARPSPRKPASPAAKAAVDESALDNPDLGPFLLKLARDTIASGDSPAKALDFALRASISFERCAGEGEPSLELAMSLHVLAAIYCSLGRFDEAVPVLERSIAVPDPGRGPDHALAAFSGHMQLGDTYSMLGQLDRSIACYADGLQIQAAALGPSDPRVAETCRYLFLHLLLLRRRQRRRRRGLSRSQTGRCWIRL